MDDRLIGKKEKEYMGTAARGKVVCSVRWFVGWFVGSLVGWLV